MQKAPVKITFKHATKMSLNTRFTNIMKTRPPTNPQTVKAETSIVKLASEKNRRLALQMEKRASVGASVPNTSSAQTHTSPGRVSVLDRLGTTRGRGGSGRGRASFRGNFQRRGGTLATNRARGILRGAMRGGVTRGRGRGRGYSTRGGKFNNSRNFTTTPGRPFRGGRGTYRGRGGKSRGAPVNKSKLDSDLDSYMSKTRGSMDAELDAYMAGAHGN